MSRPRIGAPCVIDSETRLVLAGEGDRELFQVEVRLGETWHQHSAPSESFLTAIEVARRVAHRARSERPALLMSGPQMDWPGPAPWSEARLPEVNYCGPGDMRLLSDRIRCGRNRIGWR